MSRPPTELEPAALRAALDHEAIGRCQLAAAAIFTWAAISTVVDSRFCPDAASILVPVHLALMVACASSFVGLRRGWISGRRASLTGFVLWGWQVSAMWLAFADSGQALYPMAVMLELIAAAVVHLYGRWVLLSGTLALVPWAAMAGRSAAPLTYTVILVGTAVIATLIHLVSRRYLVRIESLRQQDRATSAALEQALASARHELEERQRTEVERESLREQLAHSQRIEAVGTLAGGVAHDMNNVLAAIIGLAEFARDNPGPEAKEDLDHLLDAARRGADLTRNLMAFSRRGQYRKERIDPGEVVKSALALLSRSLPRTLVIESHCDHGDRAVEADSTQLGHALVNLCINASDAMTGAGTLRIDTSVLELGGDLAFGLDVAPGRYVAIAVSDTGSGIEAATLPRVFEPFFTTKAQGRGTGLGLAMVHGTMRSHGGGVTIESKLGVGSTFTLYLPAMAPTGIALAPPAPPELTGSGLVLVVDDEVAVREVTARRLTAAGFTVLEASDGHQAVALFGPRAAEIRLVVLDMQMPAMGGAACFAALVAIDPKVRVLVCSGYSEKREADAVLAAGAAGLLPKPFTSAQLATAVNAALRGATLRGSDLVAVA